MQRFVVLLIPRPSQAHKHPTVTKNTGQKEKKMHFQLLLIQFQFSVHIGRAADGDAKECKGSSCIQKTAAGNCPVRWTLTLSAAHSIKNLLSQ